MPVGFLQHAALKLTHTSAIFLYKAGTAAHVKKTFRKTIILQYTYHKIRKCLFTPVTQYTSSTNYFYIPHPDDFDSILEPKPPLNPVPEPAFGDPQPIAPEFEP